MEYTALTSISPPGSLVYGYHRGDPVAGSVVENWGLVVGEQVVEGPLDPEAETAPVLTRPTPEATRGEWEAWAVANGMDPERASQVAQEDLEAVEPAEEDEPVDGDAPPAERPAESAVKADWVAYVSARGSEADKTWAAQTSTTKAELMAWEPAGDPIAVDASERANTADGQ